MGKETIRYGREAKSSGCEVLKCFLKKRRSFRVGHDVPQAMIVNIAQGLLSSGPFASAQLLPPSSLNIPGQTNNVISGPSAFNAHEQPRIVGQELSGRCADGSNAAFLQKPAHAAFVNRVAVKAVNIPAEQAVCFSGFNAVEHLVEARSSRLFGRFAFFDDLANDDILARGKSAKFIDLRIQAHHLMFAVVGGFADVEEVFLRGFHGTKGNKNT
ncbi:MAG: hypothetical protein A2849_02890 [Candidatus Taylorbacteria bacterium RIFCSPHIGHO2_01_FULL_51_15]|uniref:Uncharacterized protein n=1 Tax=Candidatus Taylorbacteria bacterium RIFCSPHIGHO2_01_FULL_51_15 TaxID=1802304 RepID=A0A1G2MB35_9BACT|nr:MAG: hypothetical protein A2849_02890 [Candidatus Taylorbacteria bacterium RIFCSPHIGHO2_01_FULL_51_15]